MVHACWKQGRLSAEEFTELESLIKQKKKKAERNENGGRGSCGPDLVAATWHPLVAWDGGDKLGFARTHSRLVEVDARST